MLGVKAVAAGVAIILIKNLAEGLANYIMFRLNPFIKVGTLVEIKGDIGRVKKATPFSIVIELRRGYLTLPIKKWRDLGWIVLKDLAAISAVKSPINNGISGEDKALK